MDTIIIKDRNFYSDIERNETIADIMQLFKLALLNVTTLTESYHYVLFKELNDGGCVRVCFEHIYRKDKKYIKVERIGGYDKTSFFLVLDEPVNVDKFKKQVCDFFEYSKSKKQLDAQVKIVTNVFNQYEDSFFELAKQLNLKNEYKCNASSYGYSSDSKNKLTSYSPCIEFEAGKMNVVKNADGEEENIFNTNGYSFTIYFEDEKLKEIALNFDDKFNSRVITYSEEVSFINQLAKHTEILTSIYNDSRKILSNLQPLINDMMKRVYSK